MADPPGMELEQILSPSWLTLPTTVPQGPGAPGVGSRPGTIPALRAPAVS